ncbi:Sodium-dependent high-affinity dicarboxylate transporter [Trichinella spiralis]|uniref:Sodium-dependent high-affinity dicarboxylate transporter n=1 Tax=Trichinella spiralis TaxID=6334 RepID=A0ABR3KTU6_TRISP
MSSNLQEEPSEALPPRGHWQRWLHKLKPSVRIQSEMDRAVQFCRYYSKTLIIIFAPLIFLPLVFTPGTSESKCLYVVLLMAAYWLFEVMPLAVTALIPAFLYPILGIMSSSKVCESYMPDVNFLSFGGLIVALAVEKCKLHNRVALRVLTLVGSDPKWVMFGFMTITAFLSMWMNNTACTAMMVPIAQSVIEEWNRNIPEEEVDGNESTELVVRHDKADKDKPKDGSHLGESSARQEIVPGEVRQMTKEDEAKAKSLLISIAYSSSIGGTATLTGSPTNISSIGLLKTFFHWMVDAVLLMLNLIVQRYKALPPVTFAELSVLVIFGILIVLWVLRDLGLPGFSGFGVLFKKGFFSDATSAVLISVVLFAFPDTRPSFTIPIQTEGKNIGKPQPFGTLMDWATMKARFPWDVIFLLGGGFALAAGVKASGLSVAIGNLLSNMGNLPVGIIQLLCVLMAIGITNIASNVVTASILIPIVSGLAQKLTLNPLSLILPVTLGCSYAFMLPVGTPPNAIVFAPGFLKLSDMIGAGFFISIATSLVIVLHSQTLARLYIDLDNFPYWAMVQNGTVAANMTANA